MALLPRAKGGLCSQEEGKHKLAPGRHLVKERPPVTGSFPGLSLHMHTQWGKATRGFVPLLKEQWRIGCTFTSLPAPEDPS